MTPAREILASIFDEDGMSATAQAVREGKGLRFNSIDIPLRAIDAALAASPKPTTVESSGMVERLRPNLGYETDEPSVGEMVLDYYRRHFPIGEAFNLRDRYFASLSASSPSSEQGRG